WSGDPRHRLEGHHRGGALRPPREVAVHAARGPHRPLRRPAERPVRRMAPVHGQGPPPHARAVGEGSLQPGVLRQGPGLALRREALGGARRRGRAPGPRAGGRPRDVEDGGRQDPVHAAPPVRAAVHEPAERDPPGDDVQV
ncbi:MAG: hypothetical protein AVDCRST_MAG30-3640, partial [uncultured Solirubrobacteraceae bacterium]